MRRKLCLLAGVAGDVGVDGIISQNEPKLSLTWARMWAGGDGDLLDFDLGGFGVAALGLDFAELFESAVELTGESRFVHAECGEGAGLLGEAFCESWGESELESEVEGIGIGGAGGGGGRGVGVRVESGGEEGGFEGGDAIQAPGGGGEGEDELFFEGAEGLEVGEEALVVELELGGVLGGQEGGAAGEAVAEGVQR
ncbi:MAG: hypothetical protein LAP38_14245 [Acidobacteriia bacterium]|nr:hypothetical protein [Terriglobia bacterium]